MARPLNKAQKTQAEGRLARQRTLDAILDLMTGDVISSERMRESAMALIHFERKLLEEIDRVALSYDNRLERDVRTTLLLGIALRAMEKLVGGCRCLRNHRTANRLAVAQILAKPLILFVCSSKNWLLAAALG